MRVYSTYRQNVEREREREKERDKERSIMIWMYLPYFSYIPTLKRNYLALDSYAVEK